jgi:hypothetical protein
VPRYMDPTTGEAAGRNSSCNAGGIWPSISSTTSKAIPQTTISVPSSATPLSSRTSRLRAISKCTDELARLRDAYGLPDVGDRYGVTLGEMDWAEELHRLLYDY